jgi:hypothetical protein
MFWLISLTKVADSETEIWMIERTLIEALRNNGNLAQARGWAEWQLTFYASWALNVPTECWEYQMNLADARILAAGVLDPTVPAEAARRQDLLEQAAAMLAPDKIAGRLTVDVQEMLREMKGLQAETAPASR